MKPWVANRLKLLSARLFPDWMKMLLAERSVGWVDVSVSVPGVRRSSRWICSPWPPPEMRPRVTSPRLLMTMLPLREVSVPVVSRPAGRATLVIVAGSMREPSAVVMERLPSADTLPTVSGPPC